MAKFSFTLAQKFNVFYHKYRVLSEKDRDRQMFYLLVVDFVRQSLTRALDLMASVFRIGCKEDFGAEHFPEDRFC